MYKIPAVKKSMIYIYNIQKLFECLLEVNPKKTLAVNYACRFLQVLSDISVTLNNNPISFLDSILKDGHTINYSVSR